VGALRDDPTLAREARVRPGDNETFDVRLYVENEPGLFDEVFLAPITDCRPWSTGGRVTAGR
jgi:hypothetical protein